MDINPIKMEADYQAALIRVLTAFNDRIAHTND